MIRYVTAGSLPQSLFFSRSSRDREKKSPTVLKGERKKLITRSRNSSVSSKLYPFSLSSPSTPFATPSNLLPKRNISSSASASIADASIESWHVHQYIGGARKRKTWLCKFLLRFRCFTRKRSPVPTVRNKYHHISSLDATRHRFVSWKPRRVFSRFTGDALYSLPLFLSRFRPSFSRHKEPIHPSLLIPPERSAAGAKKRRRWRAPSKQASPFCIDSFLPL